MDVDDAVAEKIISGSEGLCTAAPKSNTWLAKQKLRCSISKQQVDMFSAEAETGGSPSVVNISSVAYNDAGNLVAVGDSSGQITIYEKGSGDRFEQVLSFESHSRDFDYLRSLEIEETINKMAWCASPNGSKYILSTNDKTIKLWKIDPKKAAPATTTVPESTPTKVSKSASWLHSPGTASSAAASRRMMRNHVIAGNRRYFKKSRRRGSSVGVDDSSSRCKARRVYKNAHAYHINSISVSSDGETFLSADDLRVNLWRMERSACCFMAIDMKPPSMDTLSEVLTAAMFHPFQSHIFAYSTSTGSVKLADMRVAAKCDNSVKEFKDTTTVSPNSFFAEILDCISDIKFTNGGHQLLLRDYMSLKLWDARMEHRPALVIDMQGYLVPKLRELYMHDLIFDKFKCSVSHDDSTFLSGTYGGVACAFERTTGLPINAFQCETGQTLDPSAARKACPIDDPMWRKKTIHCSFHPKENLLSVGTADDLALFTKR